MTRFTKILALLLVIMVTLATVSGTAAALPAVLYQKSEQETITAGATLEHISRFTADGWLNIKVLRIDTENPNIKMDTLANRQITDKLLPLPELARQSGAVAAVNASFFNAMGGGTAYPDGPIVRAGDLLSTTASYNQPYDTMASFAMDRSGRMMFDYWKSNLTLTDIGSSAVFDVSQYNKPSLRQYNDITVLDEKWGALTLGSSEKYPDLIEIIVAEGRVHEIRQSQPPATMPAGGFAVISRGEQAYKLLAELQVGDEVKFSITSSPDWSALQMSATGASILVKDGKIPERFSLSSPSFDRKNPRTLIGCTQDGKQLILVTVDGRQDNSIGLTQMESAELMLELGAYHALILDGGGSTTMAARQPGTNELEVVNVPSEGSLRNITTGIGVFSTAAPGAPAKLILESEDSYIFVDTSRKFTLKAVDRYANPVEIDPDRIQWRVSGIDGSFNGNVFYPTSVGKGKIIAQTGGLTAEMDIRSLSGPVELALDSGPLQVQLGKSQALQVTGYDAEGFSARLEPADIRWTVSGGIGDCQDGVFTGLVVGSGYVEAARGDVYAYREVLVSSTFTHTVYDFEQNRADFQPSLIVNGAWRISQEQVQEGSNAGQLIFDFYNMQTPGEASLIFEGEGLKLDADTSRLTVWLYNTVESSNRIMAEVQDSAGKKHQLEWSPKLEWIGWKQVGVSLANIKEPLYLTRIYVMNTDPAINWGDIYFDKLEAEITRNPASIPGMLPADTVMPDQANREVSYTPGPENFRFSVFGSNRQPEGSLESQLQAAMTAYINDYLDMAVYTGSKAAAPADLKKNAVVTGTQYQTHDYVNSTFIQLDTGKGGLRRSDPAQWPWLFTALDGAKRHHVFVVLTGDPDEFINAKEAQLLRDTLADYREKTGKNVWVLYQGALNQSQMDRGVRYISSAGFGSPGFSGANPQAAQYLQISVQGTDISFEFKSI